MAKRISKAKKELSWKGIALVFGIIAVVYLLFYTNIISLITNSEIMMKFVLPMLGSILISTFVVEIFIGSVFFDDEPKWGLNMALVGIISISIYVAFLFIFYPR